MAPAGALCWLLVRPDGTIYNQDLFNRLTE